MSDLTNLFTWYAVVGLMMAMGMLPSPYEDEQDEERRAAQRRQLRDSFRVAPWMVFVVALMLMFFWLPLLAHSLIERFSKKKTDRPKVWKPKISGLRTEAEVEQIRREAYEKGWRDGSDRRLVVTAEVLVQGTEITVRPLSGHLEKRKDPPRVSSGS